MAEISTLNGYKIKDKKAIRFYDTVADMVADTTLKNGMYAKTKGYYSINDGGQAEYHITNTQSQSEYQEALNNNLYATLIIDKLNIKQLGAYGDNIHDDSQYFNSGIEILSRIKTSLNYSDNNTLYIPGGEYKIENTIYLSVYCKIKSIGYVTLNSYCNDITLDLSPEGIEPESGEGYERYNYLFGKLIDGEQGFRLINKLNKGSTIGLSLGNTNVSNTSLNYNVSKTSIDYITFNNYNTAIKLNPYNLYLNTFNNIYAEQNNYCIVVGDDNINNYYDSGENISFNNCIFAGSEIVCLYNTPSQAIDFNFNQCSFDFNNCLFYSPNNNETTSPGRKISIHNSHIEQVSYKTNNDSDPHGILFGQFRAYQITISNSRILQNNKYHLFYATSETSYVLNLISNIILVYGDTDASNPNYQYFANDYITNINLFSNECSIKTGLGNRLSSYNNCIIRPDWRNVETGTTYTLTKSTTSGTDMLDWKNAYFNKVSNTVTVVNNAFGGKSLRLTVDTNNPWDASPSASSGTIAWQMLSKKFNANSGDVYGFSLLYKNMKLTGNISFFLLCYDADNNLISTQQTTMPQVINANYVVTSLPRFLRCPVGTQSAEVRLSLSQNDNAHQVQNEAFEIGNISVIKMN